MIEVVKKCVVVLVVRIYPSIQRPGKRIVSSDLSPASKLGHCGFARREF